MNTDNMHIIEKLQDVRRFWRIFGVAQFLTLAGGDQVSWTQIERSCWHCWEFVGRSVTVEKQLKPPKLRAFPLTCFYVQLFSTFFVCVF